VRQGEYLDSRGDRISKALTQEPLPQETRLFDVLPETVAPIVSLSTNPQMVPGTYIMVDAGAGTTEMSSNHVNEPGAEQKIACYWDKSIVLGGDDFQRCDELSCEDSRTIESERLIDIFRRTFKETCWGGYNLDKDCVPARQRWKSVRVLLAGGASRRHEVRKYLSRALPIPPHLIGEVEYLVHWHVPANLIPKLDPLDAALLAVAHGLSIERQKWPIYFQPREMGPLPPSPVPDCPEGYWYVGGK
jgi:hypothetical protein